MKEPVDIAVSGKDEIYVLDASDGLIKIYNLHGKYLRHLPKNGKPLTFALAAEGVYVADKETLTVHRYDYKDRLSYSFDQRVRGAACSKA